MLRTIRIILAVLSLLIIAVLFLDISGLTYLWLGWMARVQLIPALLSVNLVVLILLVAMTLLFGRVYCSVICPLGILQDVVSWVKSKRKKHKYTYSRELKFLRYGVFTIFVLAMIIGLIPLVAVVDPYAAFGRIMVNVVSPLFRFGNNIMALVSQHIDNYYLYSVDVWVRSGITLAMALLTLIIIGVLAWRGGRTYCNTFCPVGTALGFLSRYAIFRPVIETSACNGCKACSKSCKASCIDTSSHHIDYSRCVMCMNCIDVCSQGAISITSRNSVLLRKSSTVMQPVVFDNTRRNFLTAMGVLGIAAVIKSQQIVGEGGLAKVSLKKEVPRKIPVLPPGSIDNSNFGANCIACGLCMTACLNNILRPSGELATFMQPEMIFTRGFCRPECTACADVCPTSAILPISVEEKRTTQIGIAVWIRERCVVNIDDVDCDACARHCPNEAITMVLSDTDNPESRKVPEVDPDLCNGCGACEYLCPARPFSAIVIEGVEIHKPLVSLINLPA